MDLLVKPGRYLPSFTLAVSFERRWCDPTLQLLTPLALFHVILLEQAHSLAWCADGKLALGSTDGWVSLWDVDSHGTCR